MKTIRIGTFVHSATSPGNYPRPLFRLQFLFVALSVATVLHAALPAPVPLPTTGIDFPAICRTTF